MSKTACRPWGPPLRACLSSTGPWSLAILFLGTLLCSPCSVTRMALLSMLSNLLHNLCNRGGTPGHNLLCRSQGNLRTAVQRLSWLLHAAIGFCSVLYWLCVSCRFPKPRMPNRKWGQLENTPALCLCHCFPWSRTVKLVLMPSALWGVTHSCFLWELPGPALPPFEEECSLSLWEMAIGSGLIWEQNL